MSISNHLSALLRIVAKTREWKISKRAKKGSRIKSEHALKTPESLKLKPYNVIQHLFISFFLVVVVSAAVFGGELPMTKNKRRFFLIIPLKNTSHRWFFLQCNESFFLHKCECVSESSAEYMCRARKRQSQTKSKTLLS